MFRRILKKDISRNKVIIATLFLFIMLASLMVSSAINVIFELFGSMDTLLEKSNAAHFAQMHSGELDQTALDEFAAENSDLIKDSKQLNYLILTVQISF